jgi:hypothetical protein
MRNQHQLLDSIIYIVFSLALTHAAAYAARVGCLAAAT